MCKIWGSHVGEDDSDDLGYDPLVYMAFEPRETSLLCYVNIYHYVCCEESFIKQL